jgi:hypothetical protein
MPVYVTLSTLLSKFARSKESKESPNNPLRTIERALKIVTASPYLKQAAGKELLDEQSLYKYASKSEWNAVPNHYVGQILRLKPDDEIVRFLWPPKETTEDTTTPDNSDTTLSAEKLAVLNHIKSQHRKQVVEPIDILIIGELVRFGALTTLFECEGDSILWMFYKQYSEPDLKRWFSVALINFGTFYYSYRLWPILFNQEERSVAIEMAPFLALAAISHSFYEEADSICSLAIEHHKPSRNAYDIRKLADLQVIQGFACGCLGSEDRMNQSLDDSSTTSEKLQKAIAAGGETFPGDAKHTKLSVVRERLRFHIRIIMSSRRFETWPNEAMILSLDDSLHALEEHISGFDDMLQAKEGFRPSAIDYDTSARCHLLLMSRLSEYNLESARKKYDKGKEAFVKTQEPDRHSANRDTNIWVEDCLNITKLFLTIAECEAATEDDKAKSVKEQDVEFQKLIKRQNLSGRRHTRRIVENLEYMVDRNKSKHPDWNS